MTQRVSKKRIRVLVNNLQHTNLLEMERVIGGLREAGYSSSYLRGLFRAAAEMLPHEYLPAQPSTACLPQAAASCRVGLRLSGITPINAIGRSNVISAIKFVREHFACGLKEAKQSVDGTRGPAGGILINYQGTPTGDGYLTLALGSQEYERFCRDMQQIGVTVSPVTL